ncbi:MAG: FAD:protein FMN transferase [Planctomycetes bacterium]|nr:FAD:protein FMN transferase [Planctomycetota bacterium]
MPSRALGLVLLALAACRSVEREAALARHAITARDCAHAPHELVEPDSAHAIAERDAALAPHEFVERHMGCMARIVLYARDEAEARSAARAAFDELARVDALLSDYRDDSAVAELARRGERRTEGWDSRFVDALARAQRVSVLTDGAFDVTVGPLVVLWRAARATHALPEEGALAAARVRVGWSKLAIDVPTRSIDGWEPGMRLDFGAIGQGIGADRALAKLVELGHESALVDVSGDVALGAPPPGARGWRVRVEGAEGESARTLYLSRCGVTTSGDTEQFVELDGVRYSHVVDPRTGRALTHAARSTVIAPDATDADAFATAFGVLGLPRAIELARALPGVEAEVVVRGERGLAAASTPGWARFLVPDGGEPDLHTERGSSANARRVP